MRSIKNKISVIITCYNRADKISNAIYSVLWQSYLVHEVIVVDDASVDGSVKVINAIQDPRVKLIEHKKNLGQNAAITSGLEQVTGDFVGFLDSDDIWLPSFCLEMIKEMNESVGFVYCWYLGGKRSMLSEDNSFAEVLSQGFLSSMITLLVDVRVLNQMNEPFPREFMHSQDDKFCFELAKITKFKLVPKELAVVIGSEDSMSRNFEAAALGWEQLLQSYEQITLKNCGPKTLAKHYFFLSARFARVRRFRKVVNYFKLGIFYLFQGGTVYCDHNSFQVLSRGVIDLNRQLLLSFNLVGRIRRALR